MQSHSDTQKGSSASNLVGIQLVGSPLVVSTCESIQRARLLSPQVASLAETPRGLDKPQQSHQEPKGSKLPGAPRLELALPLLPSLNPGDGSRFRWPVRGLSQRKVSQTYLVAGRTHLGSIS